MESYVAQYGRKTWINDFERLNGAVQVHVKNRILIVPHTGIRPCYFVSDKKDSIVTGIWLDLLYSCARTYPRLDGRFHSDGRTDSGKIEKCRAAADRKLTVGVIVKHVALPRMRLTPRVFMRAYVGGFAKIGRTRIVSWD